MTQTWQQKILDFADVPDVPLLYHRYPETWEFPEKIAGLVHQERSQTFLSQTAHAKGDPKGGI